MELEVTTQQLKRCDVIKVAGRIDGRSAPRLAEAFNALIDDGRFRIVLDMGGVEFLSSAGLHAMIDAQKTCKRWNRGEVILATVPQQVYEVLDMVGFVNLFKIFDNVIQAVGSF